VPAAGRHRGQPDDGPFTAWAVGGEFSARHRWAQQGSS
jgi:hypothetical protein